MRKKSETKYYLVRDDFDDGDPISFDSFDALRDYVAASDDAIETVRVIEGIEREYQISRTVELISTPAKSRTRQTAKGSVTTVGGKTESKPRTAAPAIKKDGTPRKKPGRKTTAEKLASASKPIVEHVAESRNGNGEHVGEEVQS